MVTVLESIKEDLKIITRVKWSEFDIINLWNWWCQDYCKSDRILNYNSGDYSLLENIIVLYQSSNNNKK